MARRLFRFECGSVQKPRDPAELSKRYELPERWVRCGVDLSKPAGKGKRRKKNGQFSSYLASNFKSENGRRKQPSVERNKLIVVTIFVGLILFAILYHICVG